MSGLCAKTIQELQTYWKRAKKAEPRYAGQAYGEMYKISRKLEKMELNLTDDTTYELLETGLTCAAFNQLQSYYMACNLIHEYHRTLHLDTRLHHYDQNKFKYHMLKKLVEKDIPNFEGQMKKAIIGSALTSHQRMELEKIRLMHKTGVLHDALSNAAKDLMHDAYRIAKVQYERLVQSPEFDFSQTDLGIEAARVMRALVKEQGLSAFPDETIPKKRPGFWSEKWGDEVVDFDVKNIDMFAQEFIIRMERENVKRAIKFQQEGHYVLDFSGSGHGAMGMPFQKTLERLVEYDVDVKSPETFKRLGLDIESFYAAYHKERKIVSKNPKYAKLVKPAFTR